MMRIISGRARGTRLRTLEGDATRPTSERAKEAVFSMLQFELADARVLDLFAGSGQMGLEALSRGAAHAVFCDASKKAVEIIKANVTLTHSESTSEIVCADYTACLARLSGTPPFDLVFLDPPYALGLLPTALKALADKCLLRGGSILVCESADPTHVFGEDEALAARFEVFRTARYGAVHVTLMRFLR